MASKLPKEIWVDREAIVRPNICSHISSRNEFEPGVRVHTSDQCDREFEIGLFAAFVFGVLWAITILFVMGRL